MHQMHNCSCTATEHVAAVQHSKKTVYTESTAPPLPCYSTNKVVPACKVSIKLLVNAKIKLFLDFITSKYFTQTANINIGDGFSSELRMS